MTSNGMSMKLLTPRKHWKMTAAEEQQPFDRLLLPLVRAVTPCFC